MTGSTLIDVLSSITFENDWIVDSSCDHHLTNGKLMFSSIKNYYAFDAIITTDNTLPVEQEPVIGIKSIDDDDR